MFVLLKVRKGGDEVKGHALGVYRTCMASVILVEVRHTQTLYITTLQNINSTYNFAVFLLFELCKVSKYSSIHFNTCFFYRLCLW